MNNRLMPVSEGETEGTEVKYLDYGNHKHAYVDDKSVQPVFIGYKELDGNKVKIMASRRSVQALCVTCSVENDHFLDLQAEMGSEPLSDKMYYMKSQRAYNQRWPFDEREKVLSTEAVFEERADGYSSEPASLDLSITDLIMDREATDMILSVLPEEQRKVIEYTVMGYKPREIAEMKGDKNSARVRQDKYSAMRTLGAPINRRMRRVE